MIRIKDVRKSKNITARELADFVNVAESTMSLYENGKREADYKTLLKIAEYLNVSVDYLLGKSEEKENPAEGEIAEDVVIYHRDGKTVRRTFTKDQLDMISAMLDAIPDKPKDI